MSVQMSFDQTRFRRAISKAVANHQSVAAKRVGFTCPECGAKNRATVEQIAAQATIDCAGCHRPIGLVDTGGGFGRTVRGQ